MLWWIIGILVTPLLILYAVLQYYNKDTDFWPKRGVKLLRKNDIGSLFERITMKYPLHEFDARGYRIIRGEKLAYGGTEQFHSPVFIPADLELIKRIMVKDFDYFVNRKVFESVRGDKILRQMLSVKENQDWKDLRSTMSPTFSTGKIRRMFDIFEMCSSRSVDFLHETTSKNTEVEISDSMRRYTIDVIAWAAFGVDSKVFQDENSSFARMGKTFEKGFKGVLGMIRIALIFIFPKIGKLLKISVTDKATADFFADVITKTIKHRQSTGEKRQDFLQLMTDAQAGQLKADEENFEDQFEKDAKLSSDKTNKIQITDSIILSQSLLFFLAGFSTVQNLIIFCAFELALNPDVQEKLAKEVDSALKKNSGKFSYDDVNNMVYLEQVVSETLRKYPPAVQTDRVSTSDYAVPDSNVVLPKGCHVVIPIWAIHHDPEYFPDPEKFDPERFNSENKAQRHPYAYMPFGAGPRNCIAMRFALMEGKAAIAKLVHNFILEPSSKTTIPIKHGKVNLKPDDGIWLNVKPRSTAVEE